MILWAQNINALVAVWYRVPDLQSGGCGFESRSGLPRTKVYSAFHPSVVGKWVPAAAGKAKELWLIPIADEGVGVQVKLWNPLRTRAIPEHFCGGVTLRRGAMSSVCTFTLSVCTIRYALKYLSDASHFCLWSQSKQSVRVQCRAHYHKDEVVAFNQTDIQRHLCANDQCRRRSYRLWNCSQSLSTSQVILV